jgi:predicted NBD/HSP70 family sugar kinase
VKSHLDSRVFPHETGHNGIIDCVKSPRVKVARGLLLHGERISDGTFNRKRFFQEIGVDNGTLRSAAGRLGAKRRAPGFGFFDSSQRSKIAFGPGAGLAIGVSLGHQSLRAALVDANGTSRVTYEGAGMPGQLEEPPPVLLGRIQKAAGAVLAQALEDKTLQVDGAVPFLGISVAWPTPLTRDKLPVGHALGHHAWHSGTSVTNRVANHLGIDTERSNAMNDAAAAAIAVAYDQTTRRDHLSHKHPRLTVIVRLAGGIGAGMVVVEPPQHSSDLGSTSGFPKSILIGGVDHHAGEIGHVPVNSALVKKLDRRKTEGLGPLVARPCSCVPTDEPELGHLESYAGGQALAARIDDSRPAEEVIGDIVGDPEADVHKRALEDIGTLIGDALISPLAMLNPASIVLTGTLALPPVEKAMQETLASVHRFGTQPGITRLDDDSTNQFVRARGAALVVLRRQVFRRLPDLLDGEEQVVCDKVRNLTTPLPANPWEQALEAK